MVRVNKNGYLERQTSGTGVGVRGEKIFRSWYLIKNNTSGSNGQLNLGILTTPKEYIGKKVRFKVEILEE